MKKKKSFIIAIVIGCLVGVAGALVGAALPRTFGAAFSAFTGFNAHTWLPAPVYFFLALVSAIIIHELGHLAAALSAGFRFRVLTLGPWSIIATPAGLRHRISFKILGLIQGQQISTPVAGEGTDRQFVRYLAGGGFANLVTAGVAFLALMFPGIPADLRAFLFALSAVSIILGIVNLLPWRTAQGVTTDGYNIRAILRNDDEALRFRALFDLMGNIYSGVRPRDWSRESVACLQGSASSNYEKALGPLLSCQYALDQGDLVAAGEAALASEGLLDSVPKAFKSHFAIDLAYYFGAFGGDAIKARRHADTARNGGYLLSASSVQRALAAAAFAERRFEEAIAACDRGIAAAADGNNEMDRILEPELINALRARAVAEQKNLTLR